MFGKMALALMLGFPLAAAAQEATPPATVTSPAGFSAGFQKLIQLGLPSLEGAEWTTAGDESRDMGDYELREIFAGLKGKGWKIEANGKPAFLPLGEVKAGEAAAGESGGSGGGLLGALFGGGSKKPKAADLVADANKLIATFEDPDKSKDFREGLEYRGTGSLGRLLIFATQLHQTGHPAEANRLASTVFSLGVNPEAVIDGAINRLAERDLGVVTEAFFTSKDWAAYERGLRVLTERYPRGWETYPAVQMLLPAVKKRVAGGMPAKPVIEGATLHPEAIAALDAALQDTQGAPDDEAVTRFAKQNGIPLANLTPALRSQITEMLSHGDEGRSGGPWLIEAPPGAEAKDPWSSLKRLGFDALPALAAVATDETLTFSRNASSSRSSYGSSSESAADRALSAYQSMDRPLTRGELACRLLASTLPGGDHEESGAQTLADSAMEFWKAHHGKSQLEVLLVFLTEGDASQKQTAGTALAEMPDEAAHLAFEKYVLESDDLTSMTSSVTPYLKLRKAAARDFFTRFSAAFKAQLEGVDLEQISGGYQIKQAGGVDKYLKKLSLFVSGESPRKLVLALAKAEKPDIRQINSLAGTVAESSPDQLVPLYLEGAVTATNLETRAAFLDALTRSIHGHRAGNEEAEKETPIPAAQIPNWTILLEDERSTAEGEPIHILAAGLLEQLHSPATLDLTYEINQIDPKASSVIILARANARIAGKSPMPLPDAEKVTTARMDEMLEQLAAAKPEAVHDLANSWPLDDRLAFMKWREDPEHAAKLPASVIAARKLLLAPDETGSRPVVAQTTEILQSLDLKPGAKINYDLLTNLANTLAFAAKKQSGLAATFTTSPLDTGTDFQALRLFDPPGKVTEYDTQDLSQVESALEDSNTEAAVGIGWISERRWEQAFWKFDGKTVTPPEAGVLEKLRESLAVLDHPEAKRFHITLSVLHRDDLEKLNNLEKSEEDEDPDASGE